MSLTSSSRSIVSCPRCRISVAYADIIRNDLDCTNIKLGNTARVVLEPCYCQATSQDIDFKQMVQTFERFNAINLASGSLTA